MKGYPKPVDLGIFNAVLEAERVEDVVIGHLYADPEGTVTPVTLPQPTRRLSLSMTEEYHNKLAFLHAYHHRKAHAAGYRDPISQSQVIRFIIEDAFNAAVAEEKAARGRQAEFRTPSPI